jgi:hypothetical protein
MRAQAPKATAGGCLQRTALLQRRRRQRRRHFHGKGKELVVTYFKLNKAYEKQTRPPNKKTEASHRHPNKDGGGPKPRVSWRIPFKTSNFQFVFAPPSDCLRDAPSCLGLLHCRRGPTPTFDFIERLFLYYFDGKRMATSHSTTVIRLLLLLLLLLLLQSLHATNACVMQP